MSTKPIKVSKTRFFEFCQEIEAFDQSMGEVVRLLVQAGQPIPKENVYHLTHGSTWDHPAAEQDVSGEMKQHSVMTELDFADLRDGKLAALPLTIEEVVNGMKRHFYETMPTLSLNMSCNT